MVVDPSPDIRPALPQGVLHQKRGITVTYTCPNLLSQVTEMGSHQELLAEDGQYADLWNKQLSAANVDDHHHDNHQEAGNGALQAGE